MKNKLIKSVLAIIFITIAIVFYVFDIRHSFTVETLKESQLYLKTFVQSNYTLTALAYMVTYMLTVLLSLPLGGIFTLAGGFLFGVLPTVIYVDIAATVGAVGAFLLARYVFGDAILKRYPYYAKKLSNELEKYGWSYMLSIRLNTAIPFFMTNMVIGLTPLPLSTFIWTTFFGIIPSIALFAFAGQQLSTVNRVRDIVTPNILIAFGLLALVPIVSMFISRRYRD